MLFVRLCSSDSFDLPVQKEAEATLEGNVKKSWKRASKILDLPSLLLFLSFLFFLYFAVGFLIKYLDEK